MDTEKIVYTEEIVLRKKIIIIMLCVFTIFIMSCGSTPEPETLPPAPAAEPTPAPEPEPTPVEPKVDLTQVNSDLAEQVSKAREKAISVGVQKEMPTEFESVDKSYNEAKSAYDAGGDQQVFNDKAKETLDFYKALELTTYAQTLKNRIDELDFAKYNEEKYASGVSTLAKTKELFVAKATVKETLDSAQSAYNDLFVVFAAGYSAISSDKKTSISEVKEQADSIKASKADKEGYAGAMKFYEDAEKEFTSENYEIAYENYTKALESMTKVYERVFEKRKNAEEAIARAKERMDKTHQFAAAADEIAPLPEEPAEEVIEVQPTDESVPTATEETSEAVNE